MGSAKVGCPPPRYEHYVRPHKGLGGAFVQSARELSRDEPETWQYHGIGLALIGDPLLEPLSVATDSDGDLLSDSYEKTIGTDQKLEDTDGDGLSDYETIQATSPVNFDTDNDGIGDEDDPTPLDARPETASQLILSAQEAVTRAQDEGRTRWLDEAERRLAKARET
jgi:hypothetical protein